MFWKMAQPQPPSPRLGGCEHKLCHTCYTKVGIKGKWSLPNINQSTIIRHNGKRTFSFLGSLCQQINHSFHDDGSLWSERPLVKRILKSICKKLISLYTFLLSSTQPHLATILCIYIFIHQLIHSLFLCLILYHPITKKSCYDWWWLWTSTSNTEQVYLYIH